MMVQKQRRIGMDMKPREDALPTAEGQKEVPSDPLQEQINAVLEGGDLESVSAGENGSEGGLQSQPPEEAKSTKGGGLQATQNYSLADLMKASENAETAEPEAVQNLDPGMPAADFEELVEKVTPIVTEGIVGESKHDPEPTGEEAQAEIEKLRKECIDNPRTFIKAAIDTKEFEKIEMYPGARLTYMEPGEPRTSIKPGDKYAIGVDYGTQEDEGAAAVIRMGENGAPDEVVDIVDVPNGYDIRFNSSKSALEVFERPQMGELPTGEYRHTVRVAEGYIEGAKTQAEADNMDLESWLSLQLNTYLEQWWYAAGPKS